MISRLLYTKIWKDSFFAGLDPLEKLLFIYYIANEKVNIIHLYESADRETMFDTGVTLQQLTRAKNKFQAEGKLHFFKDYVYIANASRYQTFSGEKNDKAKENLLRQIPNEVLNWFYKLADTPMHTPINTLYNRNHNQNQNHNQREEEVEKKGIELLRKTAQSIRQN